MANLSYLYIVQWVSSFINKKFSINYVLMSGEIENQQKSVGNEVQIKKLYVIEIQD